MSDMYSPGQRRVNSFANAYDDSVTAGSQYDNVDVLAIAADDPFWSNGQIPQSSGPKVFQDTPQPADNDDGDDDKGDKPPKKSLKERLAGISRKQWIIISAALIVVIAGGTTAALLFGGKQDKPAPQQAVVKKAAPAPAPKPKPTSPLTGIEVEEGETKRPIIGVMIENSTFARPQSGLMEAGVVYEAIAEYGITRFLALYQEANPGNIGPVRSARPYYVDWAHSYDAAYAHVGGSPDALDKISGDGTIRDMNQFFNSGSFRRISQREAPHNVYTTGQQLRDLANSKGWSSSTFTPLARKKEAKAEKPTATTIDIAISGPTYNVHYDYDAGCNCYLRKMAGDVHKDAESGRQLSPKVVIGLATQYGTMSDGYHSTYTTTGSGTAKIFQDGLETDATWKRDNEKDNYHFTDTTGKPVALDPGQTWITLVGDQAAITYSSPTQ